MAAQSNVRFTLKVGDVPLDVVEFDLDEGLSEGYRLRLTLVSADPAVDFGKVLDCPAALTIWQSDAPVRYVHGVVSSFEQGETGFRRTFYYAVVEPELARLELGSDWRAFQAETVPQIIARVLKEQRIVHVDFDDSTEHLTREYCVQAGDTHAYFLERIAREEGFVHGFLHTENEHKLIYCDRLWIYGGIQGGPVLYNPMAGGDQPEPALRRFRYTENVRTAQQTQRDYVFTHPRYNQEHSPRASDLEHQGDHYERFDYPGRYKQDAAGTPFTLNRLRGHRRDAKVATVEGDDARLQPGLAFDLTDHPRDAWNRGWRVIRMRHRGVQHTSLEEDSVGAEQGTHYSYTAELVPDDVEWRPEPLPKPRIDGPQPATVVGPEGEEIFCDEWARVKIQFPWDRRGTFDDHSSCWVRAVQNWAGATWGHIAIPRIGQEVLVIFVNGDPDQPIIIGRTFMATQLPPYELPRHKTRMTIKSKTHKGDGFNELRFEDEKDQEEIFVHAQKDQNVHVNHDETTFVGHDRSENVEHDETVAIGHDRKETVGNDEQVTIGQDRRHQIGQDDFLAIERNHTVRIGKDRTEEVGNHRHDTTTANHSITIGGHLEEKVAGYAQLAAGQAIRRKTRVYELGAANVIVIRGPGGTLRIDASGITISGIAIKLEGPLRLQTGGRGNALGIAGAPNTGLPMDRACAMRADGTCPRKPCPCGKGAA
ncbi:type VI secretion system Vgr family protein [Burkholderia diffusa]|uniref:Type IV secretion protein Rhs n=1 Tax=Burkholderia diffusa TaxID=488732 RepID=A0A6P2NPB3_9BURK|nr:type VI secretion system tip protein TssI/VgrG [Burkholderia diffusa]KAB0656944.1 type VI secretion system tip protein VgrG [Burkholderia diffusa]MBM2655642.1 type VI secretion system tip protein VgrG [Burkholderia diffusa]VWB96615.1 type IV secretion protein Rhs [Burkholderia diffusa]